MTLLEVYTPYGTLKQKRLEGFNKDSLESYHLQKIKKWYDKENPASWQEHLSHVLPDAKNSKSETSFLFET